MRSRIQVRCPSATAFKKMMAAVSIKDSNISPLVVEIFLKKGCSRCTESKPHISARAEHTPILTKGFNRRGQVDLIDMQSAVADGYNWIMVYQDHGMKFAHLRRLKSKHAVGIAKKLLHIFMTQGAPAILQSDNGREFVNEVIEQLVLLWPSLKIVHGRPRHSESQGSVERLNRTIEDMLLHYLRDNPARKWCDALPFVQWSYNTRIHDAIKKAPYQVVYGSQPRVGLDYKALGLTSDQIASVMDEEGLEKLMQELGVGKEGEIHSTNIQGNCLENAGEDRSPTLETNSDIEPVHDSAEPSIENVEETEDGNCTLNIGSPEAPCRKRLRDEAHEALHN